MMHWAYSGVDFTIPGAGGSGCVSYLSVTRIITETVLFVSLFSYFTYWSFNRITIQQTALIPKQTFFKQLLLVSHCLVFGVELGFKFASQSFIWILNPCHILTAIQIVMLASCTGELMSFLYRLQLHMLNGPVLALALPVLNTRLLPFECVVYFVQHALLLLIPVTLMDQSTVFSAEPIDDISWAVLSLSLQVIYHFLVLQPIALATGVNLNNILCPSINDPFRGPNFRLAAMLHQPFLILILGKCITYFSLTWNGQQSAWVVPSSSGQASAQYSESSLSSGLVYHADWPRYPSCQLEQPSEISQTDNEDTSVRLGDKIQLTNVL